MFLTLFDKDVIWATLGLMGKGMLGIFSVLIVIAMIVYALTLIDKRKK